MIVIGGTNCLLEQQVAGDLLTIASHVAGGDLSVGRNRGNVGHHGPAQGLTATHVAMMTRFAATGLRLAEMEQSRMRWKAKIRVLGEIGKIV